MPFAQGMFGVGALLAPLVIRFMAVDSYYTFAALNLLMSLLFLYYSPPQHHSSINTNKNGIKKKGVSDGLVVLIGLAFFLEVGIEMTVTGWFPSYAVLTRTFSA